jgi:glycosyltransferase involved in cell wall biosynthesis
LAFLIESIRARKLINEIKPDLLHAHYISDYGIIGSLTGFHPLILSAWGTDILVDPKKSKILNLLIRFALKKADLITCDGDNLRDAMIELGADPRKIKLIFHGVDTTKFNIYQKDNEFRKSLVEGNSPIIISCRNLRKVYDIKSLIKSIPLIIRKIPQAKFLIAGDGPDKEYLKDLADSLKITENTMFIGQIEHDELPRYLASSDIYVSTSLSDGGIAVSTMEAMACGVPLIITDVGDNGKWIKDGENGFIVAKGSQEEIANKIIFLWNNKQIMEKFSDINIKLIKNRADYHKEMAKMANSYSSLILEDKI